MISQEGSAHIGTEKAPGPVGLIIRAVFLETVRRREFYVLLLFMGLFLLGALVSRVVGIENPATATFLLNLGLTMAYNFALLLTLLTASRQFPDELEARTLYPLLAKPVSRSQYLLGKYLASFFIGLIALVVLLAMAWLPVPAMEAYSIGSFFQMFALSALGLAMIGALAIFLSFLVPKILNVVIVSALVLAGPKLLGLIAAHSLGSAIESVLNIFIGLVPNFSKVDLVQHFTDGLAPIAPQDLLGRVMHAAGITIVCLGFSTWLIERKQL